MMGFASAWIHYDKTSGTTVMTPSHRSAIEQAYRRYAKRVFREAQQRINGKYDAPNRSYGVRFSTGGFVNSPEYQNLAVVRKYNVKFNGLQQEKIAKKAATLLRKDKYKVAVLSYGDLELYKK